MYVDVSKRKSGGKHKIVCVQLSLNRPHIRYKIGSSGWQLWGALEMLLMSTKNGPTLNLHLGGVF